MPQTKTAQTKSPIYKNLVGGLNVREAISDIADNEAASASNINYSSAGAMARRGAWKKLFSNSPTSNPILGACQAIFVSASAPYGLRYCFIITDGADVWYTVNPSVSPAVWQVLTPASPAVLDATAPYRFVMMDGKVVMYNGVSRFYWDGTPAGSGGLFVAFPAADSTHIACPPSKFGIVWQNYLFWIGTPEYPNRVIFSDLGDPTLYPTANFIDVPSPYDGEPLMGAGLLYGNMMLFKRFSRYVLQGSPPDNLILSQLNGAVGCADPNSVVAVDNLIYFVSDKGLYAANLFNARQVCYKTEPRYTAAVPNRTDWMPIWAANYRPKNQIFVAMNCQSIYVQPSVSASYVWENGASLRFSQSFADSYKIGIHVAMQPFGLPDSLYVSVGSISYGYFVTIRLANVTPSKNAASVIQTALAAAGLPGVTVTGNTAYNASPPVGYLNNPVNPGNVFLAAILAGVNDRIMAHDYLNADANGDPAVSEHIVGYTAIELANRRPGVPTAPRFMADYEPLSAAGMPGIEPATLVAGFGDAYVYVFTEGAPDVGGPADEVSWVVAMRGADSYPRTDWLTKFFDFGDPDMIKVLRWLWLTARAYDGLPIDAGCVYADTPILAQFGDAAVTSTPLYSPDGSEWDIGVSDDGVITTTPGTPTAPQPTLTLSDPGGQHWAVTIDNSGALATTPTAAVANANPVFASPGGFVFQLRVATDGALTLAAVAAPNVQAVTPGVRNFLVPTLVAGAVKAMGKYLQVYFTNFGAMSQFSFDLILKGRRG